MVCEEVLQTLSINTFCLGEIIFLEFVIETIPLTQNCSKNENQYRKKENSFV